KHSGGDSLDRATVPFIVVGHRRRRFRIALGLAILACASGCSGGGRPFDVHVPPGYRAGVAAPLLVVLHGYGGNGLSQLQYFALPAASDAHGMLLVAPNGTADDKGQPFWNATDAC